jgi:hypothetical protein
MAYNSAGLICLSNTSINSQWILRTVDALGGVDAAGYVTDAGPANSGKGACARPRHESWRCGFCPGCR